MEAMNKFAVRLAPQDQDSRGRARSLFNEIEHRCSIIPVNDSELALLALLGELKSVSGYGLASVARGRGMERWAGLSASSVYNGLRRLAEQELVKVTSDRKKIGKGPVGRLFALTKAGARSVRRGITEGLAEAPEQSTRYRLSLAFVDLIGAKYAVERLRERSRTFRQRIGDVERARAADEAARASTGATLVFEYVLSGLEHERVATARLIQILKKRSRS
jgi:DNA-binding PadR family transcriptional regulator